VTSAVQHVLAEDEWRPRREVHERRVDAWIAPVAERSRRGERHPVEDFLFTYYSHRPAQLRRWSPGAGALLAGASSDELGRHWSDVDGGAVLQAPPQRVLQLAAWVGELLSRTAARPAHVGCFGLHEWAMVHGDDPDAVRHASVPLRLGRAGTTAMVESMPVRCSHFDAFRFFPESARPLNALQPTRDTQLENEQPGCLHATMDLYKWAYKLSPWIPAELVADCFALARRVRALDMRASPYDLTHFGYDPVRIETPAGRRQYVDEQRAFTAEAAPLRDRLRAAAEALADDSDHQAAGA